MVDSEHVNFTATGSGTAMAGGKPVEVKTNVINNARYVGPVCGTVKPTPVAQ